LSGSPLILGAIRLAGQFSWEIGQIQAATIDMANSQKLLELQLQGPEYFLTGVILKTVHH
jgi:hypothetical protein